jgi:predicted nucleic acid-binding protein
MNVLVDTPVWSFALRRKQVAPDARDEQVTRNLEELVRDGRVQMIGPIRQELLSGIREQERFRRLREHLRAFDELSLQVRDHEHAAEMSNYCRARGIAGSAPDFLICAVAYRYRWQIFTTDRDFVHYAKVLPIQLYAAG